MQSGAVGMRPCIGGRGDPAGLRAGGGCRCGSKADGGHGSPYSPGSSWFRCHGSGAAGGVASLRAPGARLVAALAQRLLTPLRFSEFFPRLPDSFGFLLRERSDFSRTLQLYNAICMPYESCTMNLASKMIDLAGAWGYSAGGTGAFLRSHGSKSTWENFLCTSYL